MNRMHNLMMDLMILKVNIYMRSKIRLAIVMRFWISWGREVLDRFFNLLLKFE